MTEPTNTQVKINGIQLEVPTYQDPETTQTIASEVTDILKGIEDSSERIDTQRFALETCMRLATDLARERDRTRTTDDEFALQLASVNASLESLLKIIE